MSFTFDKNKTALMIMDYQNAIVDMVPEGSQALLGKAAKALAAARSTGVKVIYVVIGFRPGLSRGEPIEQVLRGFA
jgi:nicotinamidase-related amidase